MDAITLRLSLSAKEQLVFSHGIVAGLIELVSYICNNEDHALILTPSYGPFKMACDENQVEVHYSPLINERSIIALILMM